MRKGQPDERERKRTSAGEGVMRLLIRSLDDPPHVALSSLSTPLPMQFIPSIAIT